MRGDLLVMDVGTFDGADIEYYLTNGFRVVAIEAPALVDSTRTLCSRAEAGSSPDSREARRLMPAWSRTSFGAR